MHRMQRRAQGQAHPRHDHHERLEEGRRHLERRARILDPENGKTYRCTVNLAEQGRKLEMRGYVGIFFRTQVWERIE
jgi:hypothetical protein